MPLSPATKASHRVVRRALKDMFLEAEQTAINGYTTHIGDGVRVFNDEVWKEGDPDGFKIYKRARNALGLKPYEYRGRGRAPGRSI